MILFMHSDQTVKANTTADKKNGPNPNQKISNLNQHVLTIPNPLRARANRQPPLVAMGLPMSLRYAYRESKCPPIALF